MDVVVRKVLLTTLVSLVASTATAGGIPPEVADLIDGAEMLADSQDFVGSFVFTLTTVIQKPNGKARHEMEMVVETTRHGDGSVDHLLIRMVKDGKDVTAANRGKVDELMTDETESKDNADEGDEDFVDPFGETADRYKFSSLRREGDSVLVDFEPQPNHRKDDGMAAGTVAWQFETLDPLWMEIEAVEPPKHTTEFAMRMEFERLGELVHVQRLFTTGLANIILIKRQFEMDIRITDVRPDDNESLTSSMEMSIE